MNPRLIQSRLLNALDDTPLIGLTGAARTGKSTLLRELATARPDAGVRTFADPATFAQASADPVGFLQALPELTLLDDLDRVPGLVAQLRPALDRGGRFLLSSTRAWPGLAETFAGRLETHRLWPLAQAEFEGAYPGLIDACFQGEPERLRWAGLGRTEQLGRVLAGGFPEAAGLAPALRERWFHDYLSALVRRDFRAGTDIRDVHSLTRLLTGPGADPRQLRRIWEVLENLHLAVALPGPDPAPWHRFADPGLHGHFLGMTAAAVAVRPVLATPLLETFLVMELVKTAPCSQSRPRLRQLRAGAQLLVLLEDRRGALVAITVTASATVPGEALEGLRDLRRHWGDRLKAGLVLHLGESLRSVGPGLWTAPLDALWASRS